MRLGRLQRWLWAGFAAIAATCAPARAEPPPVRPNFVLILVDDAALMDFGSYGGEARTPNIDRLAGAGTLFTHYRTSPLCAPSRAMLLTGIDNHRNGVATIPEVLPPEHAGKPGYGLRLEPDAITVAERLRRAGYRTYMAGKWHLGSGKSELPPSHGFQKSFALDASGADNWEQKPYMPYYDTAPWFEDGKPATLPADFYSSEFIVDRMIRYLADQGGNDPFFAYLAFQAVHIPVQAPRAYTAHYETVYDKGWDSIRETRWRRAQAMGLIPEGAPLAAKPAGLREWKTLPDPERRLLAKSMAVNAGMIEAMDHHIGRLIAYLDKRGVLQNTVFVVTSDNGPEPNEPVGQRGFPLWMRMNGYDQNLDRLGEKGSFVSIGPEWATAAAAPLSLFKFYASEGGLRVPFIMSGPGIAAQPRVSAAAFVTDVAPTLLDIAGIEGSDGKAMTGRSLTPVLSGTADHVYSPDTPIGMEVSGNAALYRGEFKLVRNLPPHGDGTWKLYDLSRDPGETRDLSAAEPARLQSMLADYQAYAKSMGVLDIPEGYDPFRQITLNTRIKILKHHGWALGGILLALVAAIAVATRLFRKHKRRHA
jgi:arylsulfatase A-like enzyme